MKAFRRNRLVAPVVVTVGAVLLLGIAASPGFAVTANITIGPQAMEGNLKVLPGDILSAGQSFTMPGSHPQATVHIKPAGVVFNVECVSGSGGGTVLVKLANATYSVPENSSAWFPTGDQHDPAAYQGSVAMPDLCGGGQMTLQDGGTFKAFVTSDDTTDKVNVRFHYSANGTAGSWSATVSVIPAPCPPS